jgi:hypothetical protein
MTRDDLIAARSEIAARRHPVPVEFDLANPSIASRSFFDERAKFRLDPAWRSSDLLRLT